MVKNINCLFQNIGIKYCVFTLAILCRKLMGKLWVNIKSVYKSVYKYSS